MDSDDDFVAFSQPAEPSPEVMSKRLKRLKKSGSSRDPLPEVFGDPVLFTHVDFAKIEALENDSERPLSEDSNSSEEKTLSDDLFSQDTDGENDDRNSFDGKDGRKAKRALDFSDSDRTAAIHPEGTSVGLNCEDLVEEKIQNPIGVVEKKKKQKVSLSDTDGDHDTHLPDVSKRRQRQRKTQLKELHAETQRILRETRDATFKPAPVVQKPISAILEKIRKRKFELSKQGDGNKGNCTSTNSLPDLHVSAEVREDENLNIVSSFVDEDGNTNSGSRPCAETFCENEHTREIFDCTVPDNVSVELSDEQPNSIKGDSAPSLLNSNMEFDSASVDDDDSSSEEDCNDKENIEPASPPRVPRDSTFSASNDPVKDFIDEEAEEESDSDNELGYISGNGDGDEEDIEDADDEGLNDIIATEYKEKPVDNEKRNELHQKWLEQQDAMGTDNLLQKLRCGSVLGDASLTTHENKKHESSDEDETEEDSDCENLPSKPGHISTRKAKEIILQMYSEKDDTYLSEGDDDDMETWKLTQLSSHRRKGNEAAASLASLDGNGSAREVLGRIKNLNIVSEKKKKMMKPKELSFFESTLSGRNMCSSSKSSFIGRASNHLVSSSSAKHGPRKARPFIFGMDDGNNRRTSSSILTAEEDSSDVVGVRRHHPTAKYVSASHSGSVTGEEPSDISLLAVLKESSMKSSSRCRGKDSSLALAKSIFGFTVPKTQ